MEITTDYLIVGAGVMGMGFLDEIIRNSRKLEAVIVDIRDKPGGHWNDAYPFVRLHQPALTYGVNSRTLGVGGADLASKSQGWSSIDVTDLYLVSSGSISLVFWPKTILRTSLSDTSSDPRPLRDGACLSARHGSGQVPVAVQTCRGRCRRVASGGKHHLQGLLASATAAANFLPNCFQVSYRKKLVDATCCETIVPATSAPGFKVAPGVNFIPINGR